MLAFVLSGPYWLMRRMGFSLEHAAVIAPYLLTVLGSTLPVAAVAGLVYRMSRMFEIGRIRRAAMAGVVVFGSGLFSYATVLNEHVPAAVLAFAALGCFVHLLASPRPDARWPMAAAGRAVRRAGWGDRLAGGAGAAAADPGDLRHALRKRPPGRRVDVFAGIGSRHRHALSPDHSGDRQCVAGNHAPGNGQTCPTTAHRRPLMTMNLPLCGKWCCAAAAGLPPNFSAPRHLQPFPGDRFRHHRRVGRAAATTGRPPPN